MLLGGLALLAAAIAAPASAQDAANYPNKPIRVIVPFAAGGGNDIFARLVGQKVGEILGQTYHIENRPAPADGPRPNTSCSSRRTATRCSSAPAASCRSLRRRTRTWLSSDQELHPAVDDRELPADRRDPAGPSGQDGEGLVEWAKKNPDKANYASTSPAFITATELLKLKSGMPGQMIPYKSSNEMILSLMQGQTLLAIRTARRRCRRSRPAR